MGLPLSHLIICSIIRSSLSVGIFNLGPEALLSLTWLLSKVFILFLFLFRAPVNRPVLPPDKLTHQTIENYSTNSHMALHY